MTLQIDTLRSVDALVKTRKLMDYVLLWSKFAPPFPAWQLSRCVPNFLIHLEQRNLFNSRHAFGALAFRIPEYLEKPHKRGRLIGKRKAGWPVVFYTILRSLTCGGWPPRIASNPNCKSYTVVSLSSNTG